MYSVSLQISLIKMVKTKTSVKSTSKNTNVKAVAKWSQTAKAQGKQSKKDQHYPRCCECGLDIADDIQALQCEKCNKIETWKCIKCLDLSEELYDLLATSDKHGLHWFCNDCEEKIFDRVSHINELSSAVEGLIEQWSKTESQMTQKINVLETKLLEKVTKLEAQMEAPGMQDKFSLLDEKIQQQSVELHDLRGMLRSEFSKSCTRDSIVAVDEKVTKLVTSVETNRAEGHKLRDCVQEALQEKLHEEKEEIEDIRRRSSNIIIHGLQEVSEEDAEKRKKVEEEQLMDLLHEIRCDDVSVQSLARLGACDNTKVKQRSMKVVLASEQQRDKVLSQAKNLFGNKTFVRVFIQQDLTVKQRLKRRELVEQLKQRRANGESNLAIVRDRIITRRSPMQEPTV